MKKIYSLLFLLFLAIAFSSCESNDDSNSNNQNDDAFAENFGSVANRDFIGQVVDVDNNPIQGATIKIGSSTVQTDVNGIFIINGAQVHERFAYITAKKAGYIDGSRAMVPTAGKNNVKIMLIPNTPLETIQSGTTSEVDLPNGTKVVFDGAFQDENGNNYSGSVQVAMFHLLPSDENISKLMPGMLYAQTQNNEEAALETFGMLNVELRGNSGQKLNIKEGHTAEITLKIDDNQMATAPSSIPLWHFDEEKGYWKEDGVATKVGNKYVGEVSHFTWWNCDAPFPTVSLTVTIVDANGNGISNVGVGLIANGNTWPAMGYTNNDGLVSGLIPANQTLVLNVYPVYSSCDDNSIIILYTTSIGPFTADTTLPEIVISDLPVSTGMISNVTGTLLKCDNSNVTNGYVLVNYNTVSLVLPVNDGNFSFNAFYCAADTNFIVSGVDYDTSQASTSMSLNFTSPTTSVQSIVTCNAINQYMTYQIDNGTPLNVTGLLGFHDFSYEMQVRAYPSVVQPGITPTSNFTFYNISQPGTYTNFGGYLEIEDIIYQLTSKTLTITNMGIGGDQYFDATLDGVYIDWPTQVAHNIHVDFHIYRP